MPASLCRVRINFDHLRHNLALLRASGKPLMPVVKADAYGHGLTEVSAALAVEGVDHLAVGAVAEGARLRQSGFGGCIVALLGVVDDEDLVAARTYGITPLVHDRPGLRRLIEREQSSGEPLGVAVKCDTGMARLGFAVEDMAEVAEALAACPGLRAEMLVSHLAVADDPDEDAYTRAQATRFGEAARALRTRFPELRLSLGNTACLLAFPELAGDLRPAGAGPVRMQSLARHVARHSGGGTGAGHGGPRSGACRAPPVLRAYSGVRPDLRGGHGPHGGRGGDWLRRRLPPQSRAGNLHDPARSARSRHRSGGHADDLPGYHGFSGKRGERPSRRRGLYSGRPRSRRNGRGTGRVVGNHSL